MKSKILSIFVLSILVLTLFISSISALSFSTSPTSMTFTGINNIYQNLSILNSGQETFNITGYNITQKFLDSSNNPVSIFSIAPINSTFIPSTSSAVYNVTLSSLSNGNFVLGSNYQEQIQFAGVASNNSSDTSISNTVSLNYLKTFCQNGDINDSSYFPLNVQITNTPSGIGGSSSTSWYPLDTITVQITLYNQNSNVNLNNIIFDVGLFQSGTNNNVLGSMIWPGGGSYSSYSYGSIGSNSNGQATFTFKVSPQIVSNQGAGTYYFVVRAYGNQFCIDHSSNFNDPFSSGVAGGYAEDISINQPGNNNAVIVDPTSLPLTTTASCGQSVTLNPNVYNIGYSGNSYSQNQVLVTLTNPDLGINLNQTIYGGLASGQSQSTPFTFSIPLSADQKIYPLYFRTYYGYNQNNNNGFFGNYLYASQNSFSTSLSVQGGCVYATPSTTQVTAQLVSGGKVGNPLTVQATVANTGTKTVNYNFGLEGYSSWATLSSISPPNITLAPSQSQTITLNLNVNPGITGGNQLFYLDTYSNGYLITKQPITVPIAASGFSLSSITGNAISGGNLLIWGFGLLNVILITVIIIILVRLGKKK